MNHHESIHQILHKSPVIPVLSFDDLSIAVPLATALVKGGLNVLEVTLRHPNSLEAIRLIQNEVPNAVVGAGTIVQESQLEEVERLNVKFAVSPGVTSKLLTCAKNYEPALLPGVNSASQIMLGLEFGYQSYKFFPAEAVGGVDVLNAFSGPFPSAEFCPTGGLNERNYSKYLQLENVACVAGSWVAQKLLIQQQDWKAIEQIARETFNWQTDQ